jgi:hypothetical protein
MPHIARGDPDNGLNGDALQRVVADGASPELAVVGNEGIIGVSPPNVRQRTDAGSYRP